MDFLKSALGEGEQPAASLFARAVVQDIAERTMRKAKAILNIRSFKQQDRWYWALEK